MIFPPVKLLLLSIYYYIPFSQNTHKGEYDLTHPGQKKW